MNPAPSVSVIVPARNAERFLAATLDSIRAQSVADWECVIVDDGSVDGTAAISGSYVEMDRRFRTVHQPSTGASAARNRGFREIDPGSQFVIFMDSDDIWMPDALAILRAELERNPEAPAAHGLADLIDEQGLPHELRYFPDFGRSRLGYRDGRIIRWPESAPTTFATLLITNRIFPPGLLLCRTSHFARTGGFDENIRLVEDWDLVLRLSRLGDLRFVNQVIIQYRRHRGNTSVESHRANREAARMMHHRIFFAPENDERQKQLLQNTWRAWQSYLARNTWHEMIEDFGKGRLLHAPKHLAQIYVQWHRYLRGYPTLAGI